MNIRRAASSFALLTLAGGLLSSCAAPTDNRIACDGVEASSDRLFLEQVGPDSAIISWRGDATAVCVGEERTQLATRVMGENEQGHTRARVTGLQPDTTYHYSVGDASTAPMGQTFKTAPVPGQSPEDGNVHIWILGDSGTADERDEEGALEYPGEAAAVRDGFFKYNRTQANNEPVDLVLFLGDTAYPSGTDRDWQGNYFEVYPDVLKSTYAVHTIGNHEMGQAEINICLFMKITQCADGPFMYPIGGGSQSSDPMSYDGDGDLQPDGSGPPYLENFVLPANGERGGVASGTELYYAIDYGNVHIVSLDSQLSTKDPAKLQTMRDWLIADLAANKLDWTAVIFHHPVYSKGQNHDSDVEDREIYMRETFAPVFEEYGVDVVFNGHSHSYERSWYLTGHHGLSSTFDPVRHAELNADGTPALGQTEGPYAQVSVISQADDKVVYTVAGNAGHVTFADEATPCADGELYGCRPADWLRHPAHRTFDDSLPDHEPHGIARLGSVVLDATAETLTSRFIDSEGQELDYFVIRK